MRTSNGRPVKSFISNSDDPPLCIIISPLDNVGPNKLYGIVYLRIVQQTMWKNASGSGLVRGGALGSRRRSKQGVRSRRARLFGARVNPVLRTATVKINSADGLVLPKANLHRAKGSIYEI